MLYQPENFNDCMTIKCFKCITSNANICILSTQSKKLTITESKVLVDKRFYEIIKYNMNKRR